MKFIFQVKFDSSNCNLIIVINGVKFFCLEFHVSIVIQCNIKCSLMPDLHPAV